ncbi:response regulator transcription factor [Paenibacillus lemnae]|uniref:Response regulator n=1 Tax=Paenibacillus lemnae TaxID=1330551 RepID=A0A848MAQ0_PAELE|nr:response regulator [Paenibacillus lemnae]NMO97033.1 response regulator [Paenibacillus lemnae]
MFTVIIAEDSKPILRNIKSHLQSLLLPVQVAGTAANGEEALKLICQHQPDILLTDIRMPKLDGMALIEQAKLLAPAMKVILISGYSDFEYTRRALSLQVFDYLLKPVERSELEEVLKRVTEELSRNRQEASGTREISLSDVLASDQLENTVLAETELPAAGFLLVIRRQPFTPKENWERTHLQSVLKLLIPSVRMVLSLREPEHFLAIWDVTEGQQMVNGTGWNGIWEHLESHGISAALAGQLRAVYRVEWPSFCMEGVRFLGERLGVCSTAPLEIQYAFSAEASPSKERELVTGRFTEMILQRQKDAFLLKLTEQLAKWKSDNVRLYDLEYFLSSVLDTLSSINQGLPFKEIPKSAYELIRSLDALSYENFMKELLNVLEALFDHILANNKKSGEELFQQLEGYLSMNIYSYVSIPDLADRFHVSPSYISRIIKRHTGSTFVHYYMKLKIQEACRLIQEKQDMRIKEISDALSFSDPQYFSKVFKEYTGVSPSVYKEQLTEPG